MKTIFGERLKKLRKENNETQSELAQEIGVGTSMISMWEKGINYPEVKKLIEIAEYYNVSTDYLLGLQTEKDENHYIFNIQNNYIKLIHKKTTRGT